MLKRLIAFLGAVALLFGLAVVAPQQAQATVPKPLVGYNSNTFTCYGTQGRMYSTITWNVVDVGPYLTTGRQYTIQVKKIDYHGPTIPTPIGFSYGVQVKMNFAQNGGWVNMKTGLGGDNTGMMPTPVHDGDVQQDGVGGVTFATKPMYWQPGDTVQRRLDVTFFPANSYCESLPVYPLSQRGVVKDGVNVGTNTAVLKCHTPGAIGDDVLTAGVDVKQTGVSTYTAQTKTVSFSSGNPSGPAGGITFTVDSDSGNPPANQYQMNPYWNMPDANWSGPTPASFSEADGDGTHLFLAQPFDTSAGSDPIHLTATFLHSEITPTSYCTAKWTLTTAWNPTEIGTPVPTVLFDDCTGSAGNLTVTPIWERDENKQLWRVKSLSIHQDGDVKLVLDAGTSTLRGGITYVWGGPGAPGDVTTISSGMTLAERTIDSGETQIINVDNPGKWVRRDGSTGSSSPHQLTLAADPDYLYFNLTARLYLPNGMECVPAGGWGGTGHVQDLEFGPNPS